MRNSNDEDVKAGILFPCIDTEEGIKDYYNLTSVLVAVLYGLGAICQLIFVILFIVYVTKARSGLRAKGDAGGDCCTDCLAAFFCWSCVLTQSLRSSGITGGSYSLTAVDAELGLGPA